MQLQAEHDSMLPHQSVGGKMIELAKLWNWQNSGTGKTFELPMISGCQNLQLPKPERASCDGNHEPRHYWSSFPAAR